MSGHGLGWDVEDPLRIRILRVGPWDNAAYVVACPETGAAVLIDAANEAEVLIRALQGLELVAILETHGHEDHWLALAQLQSHFPGAWTGAHRGDWAMFDPPGPDRSLEGGEELEFGHRRLRVLHTPGHTPGSLCFAHPGYVFTGDTLFPGGPGATRPPLGSFPTICESIRSQLLVLPGETVVLPGHGDATTIAREAPQFQGWVARGW